MVLVIVVVKLIAMNEQAKEEDVGEEIVSQQA